MSESKTRAVSEGTGLGGAVFIVFLVLKLVGKITWSWWWVTSPLWIPWLIVLAIFAAIGLVALVTWAWPSGRRR